MTGRRPGFDSGRRPAALLTASLRAPDRLALFEERADAFLGVLARAHLPRHFEDVLVVGVVRSAPRPPHGGFHRTPRHPRITRALVRPRDPGLIDFRRGPDPVHL